MYFCKTLLKENYLKLEESECVLHYLLVKNKSNNRVTLSVDKGSKTKILKCIPTFEINCIGIENYEIVRSISIEL